MPSMGGILKAPVSIFLWPYDLTDHWNWWDGRPGDSNGARRPNELQKWRFGNCRAEGTAAPKRRVASNIWTTFANSNWCAHRR